MTGQPQPAPGTEPDVTAEEIGLYFDAHIGRVLIADGVPVDGVEHMRTRHIAAVLNSPAALDGMRAMRRTLPPMAELLAPYAAPDLPDHGRGCLPHSAGPGCNDDCNNINCPVVATHERCTVACLTEAGRDLLYIPAWRRILLDEEDQPL